jgi:hypothetical protein
MAYSVITFRPGVCAMHYGGSISFFYINDHNARQYLKNVPSFLKKIKHAAAVDLLA